MIALPPANSVKACPKCSANTERASCQFLYDGHYGILNRRCAICGAFWQEATADTPPYEREANEEVERMLQGDAT